MRSLPPPWSGGAIRQPGARYHEAHRRGLGNILATVDREQLWHALTPRCFSPPPAGVGRAGARPPSPG